MTQPDKADLDPFRIIVGVLATRRDSDLLVGVMSAAGLRVDLATNDKEDFSHSTRIRALLPRIMAAYDTLSESAQLAAASVALRNFGPAYPDTQARAVEALALAGWHLNGDQIEASTSKLREMFFPKGSPWDAHVVLRSIFHEAQSTLTIVDPYTDGTVFHMLASRPLKGLTVRLLCGKSAPAVAAEAATFVAQNPGFHVEVRRSKDFHDRFIIVDEKACIHVGASIKDAGNTAFMVSRVEDEANLSAVLGALASAWSSATALL